jgi:hypothetical protein
MNRAVLLALGAVAWPGVPFLGALTPAQAVGESCEGVPATIVGTPGGRVDGTNGNDVIVSDGARIVYAYGGDDLICTTNTGPTTASSSVTVDGGTGANAVDRRGDASLEARADVFHANVFYGSDGPDDVFLTSTNQVATGGGDDVVVWGSDRLPAADYTGSVDLGPGNDTFDQSGEAPIEPLRAAPRTSPDLTVDGGSGDDAASVDQTADGPADLDLGTGLWQANGATTHLTGFEHFGIYDGLVDVRGSKGPDDVSVDNPTDLGTFQGRGGDDQLTIGNGCTHSRTSSKRTIAGGAGEDRIVAEAQLDRVDVDLGRGLLRMGACQAAITGFEDVTASAKNVILVGDAHGNDLRWAGCKGGSVSGGAGNDTVTYYLAMTVCQNTPAALHAFGGLGNDTLIGGPRKDRLDGGKGQDAARAGQGHDVCISDEVRKGCEVVR